MIENRKAIAPIPAVGAAGEQSHGSKTANIITEKSHTDNLYAGNLKTLSMTELYDTTYPPKASIIDGLLYAGTYLFVGAPKIGKSFFMAQLSYHVATGISLWQYDVHPGEVLYLALEDDYARIQKRLYKMFGSGSAGLHQSHSQRSNQLLTPSSRPDRQIFFPYPRRIAYLCPNELQTQNNPLTNPAAVV